MPGPTDKKIAKTGIPTFFVKQFNVSSCQEYFPDNIKCSIILPIYKRGLFTSVENVQSINTTFFIS